MIMRSLLIGAAAAALFACSDAATTGSVAPPPSTGEGTSNTEPAPEPTTHTVLVTNFAYEPERLEIRVGDTVEWVWKEGTHSVVSGKSCRSDGALDSGSHSAPFKFEKTFDVPGTTTYYCSVREHCIKGQVGTIDVKP